MRNTLQEEDLWHVAHEVQSQDVMDESKAHASPQNQAESPFAVSIAREYEENAAENQLADEAPTQDAVEENETRDLPQEGAPLNVDAEA